MTHKRVLEYLKKKGQTNTFRLARDLGIDRHKILDIIKKLESKKLVELKFGTVKFLKFPEKEKIKHKVKRVMAKRKPSILHGLQVENKELRERLMEVEKTIKVLQQKASAPPKIIRRTIVKNIIKKIPVEKIEAKPKKFELPKFNFAELNKYIQQLHVPEILIKKEVF